MKKFLLKCALFFFPILAVLILASVLDLILRAKTSFELPKDKTVLFIGDSQIETSINEKFIPGAFNNAKSADFYLNMFPRIRKLLEANPQIHTVFIDVTPLSLAEGADQRVVKGYAEELIRLNISFYNTEELSDARTGIINTFTNVRSFEKALWRVLGGRSARLDALGGFGEAEECSISKTTANASNAANRVINHDPNYGNGLTIKYLRKIVEFVHSRGGVRIIFLNPPIYHAEEFFDVQHFESILKEKFPDVEFWDYADFPIPDVGFMDFIHLNKIGAEIFSKELARRIILERIVPPETLSAVTK